MRDIDTTARIYLPQPYNHPGRHTTRRRPSQPAPDRTVAFWMTLLLGLLLLAIDLVIVLYARQDAGSWSGGVRDIFAVGFGVLAGGVS